MKWEKTVVCLKYLTCHKNWNHIALMRFALILLKNYAIKANKYIFYTYKTRISIDANAISKFDFFYNLDLLDIFFLISSNINYSNSNIFLKLRANNNIIWIKNENFAILIEGK